MSRKKLLSGYAYENTSENGARFISRLLTFLADVGVDLTWVVVQIHRLARPEAGGLAEGEYVSTSKDLTRRSAAQKVVESPPAGGTPY